MLTFVVGDDHDAITVKQFLNNAQAKARSLKDQQLDTAFRLRVAHL